MRAQGQMKMHEFLNVRINKKTIRNIYDKG
jgi:hypothetical protein